MDSSSSKAWRSLIWPSFSDSDSVISAFLSGGFCDFSPPAPFTSPANFFCGDSDGAADGVGFSSPPSPSPGDGEASSFSPSPGVGDSSACRCPGEGEGWLVCCFSALGDGEELSPGCCCCFFCGSVFFCCSFL